MKVTNLFSSLKNKVEEKSNAEDIETSINGLKQEMSGIAGVSIARARGSTEDSGNKSIGLINNIRDLPIR